MKKQKLVIFTAIGLVALFIIVSILYKNYKTNELVSMSKNKTELFERPYSWSTGNRDAKVHIVEFFDPSCGTCAPFYSFVKEIMEENEGKIRLTLRYVPFHQSSNQVVKMLEAARKQGKFKETLEMTFATQQYWATHNPADMQLLWQFLPKLGIDIDMLIEDMKDPSIDKLIAQDLADAKVLGVTKTPSYFVNGKPLQEFGYEQLEELIYSAF
ncbi:MAG: thioredoxin domain-containing protein [Sulfurospirillum sp.]|nr:thioredoxin domain-containing protein [Sulfurospirillum sp.]MBL0702491.1 thioredoxin domain-containing protein [Sulfurospirillum sp.]